MTVDILHGVEVPDPYRWLEDEETAETVAWVEQQNQKTRQALDAWPGRPWLYNRLQALLETGALTVPVERGGRLFYMKREGQQNQPLLYVDDRVLLDPNSIRDDGTVAIDWYYPSPDGSLVAYGTSEGGDEMSTMRIREVDTGVDLKDVIPRTRAASVGWLPDSKSFYYTRYPNPGDVAKEDEVYHRAVYYHRLGDAPDQDRRVFGPRQDKTEWPALDISEDGRYVLIVVSKGWVQDEVYVLDRDHDERLITIAEGVKARFWGEIHDGVLYMTTNLDAPRARVVSVDLESLEWKTLIAESEHAIEAATLSNGRLVVQTLHNATSRLYLHRLDGTLERPIDLPGIGTVAGLSGRPKGRDLYYGFQSFTVPMTVYRNDTIWQRLEAPVDPEPYETRQLFYPSKDGTRISMFVVRRKDAERRGPLLLTGYGGFNINRTPLFQATLYAWLEMGGTYALPNLRGGGEYGEKWHEDGMLERKQNTFDDFIAAAEYLIAEGYTTSDRLAIMGGSNGGLLVGAVLTQRPDLYRAVVCAVPLLDMIRYHLFRIARLWIPEYGSSDDPEQFKWLHAYSPYHHVKPGTAYPAVLLTTGASDSRVDPLHARKMAALLQEHNAGPHPILLRVESRAGHGAGKPMNKVLDESTDVWTFIAWQLGVRPPATG